MSAHPIREFLCLAVIGALLACSASAQSNCKPSPAESILSKASTPEEAAVVGILSKGFVADQRGNLQKAHEQFFLALKVAEKLPDTSPQKRQAMLGAAHAYAEEGDQKDDLILVEQVLTMDEKALGAQDPQIALDLEQVAMRYRASDLNNAGKLIDEAVRLTQATSDMDCRQKLTLLDNAAVFYMQEKRYTDAERVLRDIIQSASGAPAETQRFAVRGRVSLANVLHLEGKDGEAEEILSAPLPHSPVSTNPRKPDLAAAMTAWRAPKPISGWAICKMRNFSTGTQ